MCVLALLASAVLFTQPGSPAQWAFGATVHPDGSTWVELRATVDEGWHIYATQLPSDLGPLPTEVRFSLAEACALEGPLMEPEPVEEYDPNFGVQVRHHSGQVAFRQQVRVRGAGAIVRGEVEYMACNDKTCLPPVVVPFHVELPAPAPAK